MSNNTMHLIDLHFRNQSQAIAAYLYETSAGPILLDTGPFSCIERLTSGIEKAGFSPDDVKHVFATHIHLDHAGAAWYFAEQGATVYVHPRGYPHLLDPTRLLASAQMLYGDLMDALWGAFKPISAEKLKQAPHLQEYMVGDTKIIAHHTPGHAKHHIAWQIGRDLVAGDVAGICILDGPVLPPCPPPDIDIEVWMESIEHLLSVKEIDTYYLAHFGTINQVQVHMQHLKKSLLAFSSFVESLYRQGSSYEEGLPAFKEFVRGYLIDGGLTREQAIIYETANPSELALPGLLRYWKKREEKGE